MAHIKRLSMQGFKSFAKKTDIIFDKGINVVVGPNGSGKSNVSDALCFALGRLSIKSMRAAKAKNLLFMGSKYAKPSKEASVELVFDNEDGTFSIANREVILKRIVRRNGQSIYKINNETKTRSEVIETLAQAGIDPHGFNLVLQGQIQSIVKMRSEDRRKIIEEVAGISIYESRKEKSIRELDKTESRLKEIGTILRERTAYLRNLENEKAQAQKFKDLELTVKRTKASMLRKKIDDKDRDLKNIISSIEEKLKLKDKFKEKNDKVRVEIDLLSEKINQINKYIQRATGLEQDKLHNEIANLKAELEGLKVRKEGYENRGNEIERRIEEMDKSLPELQKEIVELRDKSPKMAKKAEDLKKKKEELSVIEEERKLLLAKKSELNSLKERTKDKDNRLGRVSAESDNILSQVEDYSSDLVHKDGEECLKVAEDLKSNLLKKKEEREEINKGEIKNEKLISVSESEINRLEKIKGDVDKIDVCPLCQSKITENHKDHVFKESEDKMRVAKGNMVSAKSELEKVDLGKLKISKDIELIEEKINSAEGEVLKHRAIKEKKEQLKKLVDEENVLKNELKILENKKKEFEAKVEDIGKIEERYESKMLEIEEISSRTEEDVDTTLLYKERELEKIRNIVGRSKKDLEEIGLSIGEICEGIDEKSLKLDKREDQEEKLNEKFQQMFDERDNIQKTIQEKNISLTEEQSEARQVEEQANYLKIGKAKLDAEKEALGMELGEYPGVELLPGSLNFLEEKLRKSNDALTRIGSINMRALEVYEDVKKEYDAVQERVDKLVSEKEDILAIIEEVDRKKRREFMKTFRAINTLFTENFSKLYNKGVAYLEIENKENIFEGGIGIIVKLAKGKYFDVTSLSGGEQTLVALSLLFSIQEHKPYHFYVFDEIDAALDKRNSERLSGLLNQYMKNGQYIVVTHNDAIITNSNLLYGVSMHEGVSKVLSLKVSD